MLREECRFPCQRPPAPQSMADLLHCVSDTVIVPAAGVASRALLDEVDHHLLELREVAHDRWQRLLKDGFDPHELLSLGLPEQQGRSHHGVQVEWALLRAMTAGHRRGARW